MAEDEKDKGGRPTAYNPDTMPEQARKLCELGATDEEVADFFDVSARTIYRWKLTHEEFCQALKVGKGAADDRVERSLFQKATGHYYTEEQAFKIKKAQYVEEVEVVDVEKYSPPDTTAQIFWLKNRRPNDWRDKQEVGLSGSIETTTTIDPSKLPTEAMEALLAARRNKPDE